MQLILISGLSGSGKSIALKQLEDSGYYCVDNLPAPLLPQLLEQLAGEGYARVGVAMDSRSGASIAALPEVLAEVRPKVRDLRFIFLDSRTEALIARFSETRRPHPMASAQASLAEAIGHERELLTRVAELGQRIDTSGLHPNVLRNWIRELTEGVAGAGLTLMFQSFGFKHGIPVDADFVFDARCLPNPFYDPELRPLSGLDAPVVAFLDACPDARRMASEIERFLSGWLPSFDSDGRANLTVAIGCTGGQHRSVYLAAMLARSFSDRYRVLVRHRSLDARNASAR